MIFLHFVRLFLKIKTLAKVSDRDSFRANQNYSDLFRYLYRSQGESFRINPKNVLYLVWWKTVKNQSDLIRLILRHQSKWIRANPESKVGIIRIDSDWKFGLDQSKLGLIRIDLDWKLGFGLVRIHLDWCLGINRYKLDWFLIVFHQTRYKTFFGLFRNDSHWLGYRYRNESK